jgi:hypothetical protein
MSLPLSLLVEFPKEEYSKGFRDLLYCSLCVSLPVSPHYW